MTLNTTAWTRKKDIPKCGWDRKTGWPYSDGFVTMFLVDNRVPARRNEVYMKKASLTLTLHILNLLTNILKLKYFIYSRTSCGIFFNAWRTPRSPSTSSAPARTVIFVLSVIRISSKKKTLTSIKTRGSVVLHWKKAVNNLTFLAQAKGKITFSINLPIPVTVRARPPKTWVASMIERSR